MSFKTFLQHLLPFLYKASRREFDKLNPEQQAAFFHGSGILDILRKQIGKAPEETRALILLTYPDLTEETLNTGLVQAAHAYNIEVGVNNIDNTISLIQVYLSLEHGKLWDGIMDGFASLITIVLAPAGTPSAKILMLMRYVYERYIQKK
jgi:hypothetical protein